MQNILLENFTKEINNTKEYINHIKLVNEIERTNINTDVKSIQDFSNHFIEFKREKKLFEHKAVIINLYGILESTITIWIKEHISNIPKLIENYNNLNDQFRENHFNLSIKLIGLIKKNSKYEDLDKEEIINKLNSSMKNPSNFILNEEAYIPQSGNLKYLKIQEAFKYLDIDLEKKLLIQISKHNFDRLTNIIDTLVLLRNDIAHGNVIENRLDITEFDEYITSLEEFIKHIFITLEEKEIEYESKIKYSRITGEIKVFKKNILDFNIENQEIKKGNYLIIRDNKGMYLKKEILDIHLNRKSYNNLVIIKEENVCILVKDSIKNNQEFYIRKKQENKVKYKIIKSEFSIIEYYLIK